MAKDPAFLFYTNDFLSGVQDLTMEERGQYITLLCLQHQKGRLTEKMIRLSCGNAAADVMAKFRQDENGNYYNPRLEIEIKNRAASAEKQRQRAVNGWKKRKKDFDNESDDTESTQSGGSAAANATALPLVNVNESVNENGIENGKGSEEGKTISEPEKRSSKGTVAQNVPELITVQEFWAECTSDEKSIALGWTKEIAYEQALSWYDSMKSKGWKVGKAATPMRDWQAASRTGIRNAVEWGKVKPPSSQQLPMPHKSFSTRVTPL